MTGRGGAQLPHPQNEKEPETTIRFQAHYALFLVGVAGFEPTTPCSQSRCANRTALHPEEHCFSEKALQRYCKFSIWQTFLRFFIR